MPYKDKTDPRVKEKQRNYWTERCRKNKKLLVKYKGGKCCICGYKKNTGGLDFHHVEEKSFAIGAGATKCLEKLKKEADKTILVCKNCHAEIHAGMHEKYANRTRNKVRL